MERRTEIILAISIFCSITFLIILITFIFRLLKIHRAKRYEHFNEIQILQLEREKEVLNTRITVQEETFALIGREIHDNINQLLTLSKLTLNSIDYQSSNDIKFKIDSGIQFISEAILGLTNISKSLNPDIIKESGITTVIEEEVFRINALKTSKITFKYDDEVNNISPEIQLIIFRISQEALRNAIMHGKAKTIDINLKFVDDILMFEIQDDGIGFDPKLLELKKFSQGLRNIEKRIGIINGLLKLNSQIGYGTNLKIIIPNITK